MKQLFNAAILFFCMCSFQLVNAEELFNLEIVEFESRQFNPSNNEQAKIQFKSSRDGQAQVKIYDRRAYQVREFSIEHITANQLTTVAWNGKDDLGQLVPDEAYFFTIEATDIHGNMTLYDPTVKLQTRYKPMQIDYDSNNQKLSFEIDEDGVLDIRSGITDGGPLLIKLLEWTPFLRGSHSIAWDGWDKNHVVQVASNSSHQLYSQIVPLPEHSLLTKGHPEGNDQIYSLVFSQDELKRKESTEFTDKLYSQINASPFKSLSPVFDFAFNEVGLTENSLPVLPDKFGITIRLQELIKQKVTETRYEILVFVDYKFVTEIEEGRSPARMNINTTNLDSGEHVLTVNIVTLQGGLATLSKRFITKLE